MTYEKNADDPTGENDRLRALVAALESDRVRLAERARSVEQVLHELDVLRGAVSALEREKLAVQVQLFAAREELDRRRPAPERPVAVPDTRSPEAPVQYVQPGQMVVSAQPRTLSTILGSSIAVCLWDRITGAGGMNHYLGPCRPGSAPSSPRFGDVAVTDLVNALLALGGRRESVDAKVFGGARIPHGGDGADHVGLGNAETAIEILRREGIPVVGGDVGGRRGRRVLFDVHTGRSWVRLL